jgi:DNA-binding MarR family transcriptional regulator
MQKAVDETARQVLEVVPLVMRSIRGEMRSHSAPDLTVPQFRTLGFIDRHTGASLSEVAEHIGLTLPSMSKLVDGLVGRKFVTRQTHAADRRRVTLALTARGHAMLASARESTLASLAGCLGPLAESDLETVIRAMKILRPVFASERSRSRNANS